MLIKLPIVKNNVIDIINFELNKFENKFIIKPQRSKETDIYKLMVSNKEFCLNKFTVEFPLEIEILSKNYLFSKYFFITAISNGFDCELNFFSNLLKSFKTFDKRVKLMDLNYISSNLKEIIKKCNLSINSRKKFEDIQDMKLYIDNQLNYTMNFIYLILFKFSHYTVKDFKNSDLSSYFPKKIISCFNLIKNNKIKFKSSEDLTIGIHLDNLKNNNITVKNIKKNTYYFLKFNDSKIIKMKVIKSDDESIILSDLKSINKSNCQVYIYDPKSISHLNFNYFIKELIKYDFKFKMLVASKIFKRNEKDIQNILKYIYQDNNNYIFLSSLRNLDFTFNNLNFEHYNDKSLNLELKILEDGHISNDYMFFLSNKYKNDKEKKIEILKVLFSKYNFPLTFNKKKLNDNFEMIIYFSLLNYQDIIKVIDINKIYLDSEILDIVPVKLKNLYFNLVKTYYQLINNSLENITYNFKYYQDYIYIYVIKNIIQDNSVLSNLLKKSSLYNSLVNVYKENFILNQLISNLTWNDISAKLDYLSYIYKKENLIFYQNKLNRNLFPDSIDYKIKGIILDKFSMYKYLKEEKDFIKWTKFLKNYIIELYEKPISISNDDLVLLGKLLFKIYRLEDQNLKDNKYLDLISFSQQNKKLVLINNRVNLMIKEKLSGIKCQINLGYFAKHLNFNNIENKIEIIENKEVVGIKIELKKVKKKYYKYKGKYMKTKTLSNSISNFT